MTLLWMVPAVLTLAGGAGAEPQRPPCNKKTYGMLWPAPESRGPSRALEMCSLDTWKYRWQAVTAPDSDLKKKRGR